MKSRSKALTSLLFTLLACSAAGAHQFWIYPGRFIVRADEPLRVMLFHGSTRFDGEPVYRDDSTIERFECVRMEAVSPVKGLSGQTTSFARPPTSGNHVLVFHSRERSLTLAAPLFERYLEEEGLDRVIEMRHERGEQDLPGREVYSRCAKALITAGEADAGPRDQVVGLPYEIVLERCDDQIVARLLLDGTPQVDARVVAVMEGSPGSEIVRHTDDHGRVVFPTAESGVWMLTSLAMSRASESADADWESQWASLVFHRP